MSENKKPIKIVLVGGGSGGPTMPLLALYEELYGNLPKTKCVFITIKKSIDQEILKNYKLEQITIPEAKLRRYFSFYNFFVPFQFLFALFKSYKILKKLKPHCVVGAGSFVQVPVIWTAWFLKIPCLIHQQDIKPSLANLLCQFFVKTITVTFAPSIKDFSFGFGFFYKKKLVNPVLIGNPVRKNINFQDKKTAFLNFGLKSDLPTLLVLGGAQGSEYINQLVYKNLKLLSKLVNIIHATGIGKGSKKQVENYYQREFIEQINQAYAIADFVLCRAGVSTISELSNLKKCAIIIPLPKTHQEINAYFLEKTNSAIIIKQNKFNIEVLPFLLRKLIFDYESQKIMKKNITSIMPHDSAKKMANEVLKLIPEI